MVKVMAVYDEDPLYAGRLAEYVNQKETFPFQAMAFSDLEKLKEYSHYFYHFPSSLKSPAFPKYSLKIFLYLIL